MVSHSTWDAHPHLAWAMWGLDEIEATLKSIESRIHKHPDDRNRAESAMADMRAARDTFLKSVEQHRQVNETGSAHSKAALETQWAAFENSVQTYLDAVGRQVTQREIVFRARLSPRPKLGSKQLAIYIIVLRALAPISVGRVEPP
jgi:hypothetical protein